MTITMSAVAITNPRLIGRVTNTVGSPREIGNARRSALRCLAYIPIRGPMECPVSSPSSSSLLQRGLNAAEGKDRGLAKKLTPRSTAFLANA
jgi:hypothetical protein